MLPPTTPPLESSLERPSPTDMLISRSLLLPTDRRPWLFSPLVVQLFKHTFIIRHQRNIKHVNSSTNQIVSICLSYVLLPMTLLMFIWTLSCLRLMANTTSVSHGEPCCAAAFPLRNDGVEVLVTESVETHRHTSLVFICKPQSSTLSTELQQHVHVYLCAALRSRTRCGNVRWQVIWGVRGLVWHQWRRRRRGIEWTGRPMSSSTLYGWTQETGAARCSPQSLAWQDLRLQYKYCS